jgi:hypothetical protein
MSKIFNLALSAVRSIVNVESTVVKTDKEIVYRIPRGFLEADTITKAVWEGEYLVVVTSRLPDVTKICPVAKSALDGYRGRGIGLPKKMLQ